MGPCYKYVYALLRLNIDPMGNVCLSRRAPGSSLPSQAVKLCQERVRPGRNEVAEKAEQVIGNLMPEARTNGWAAC